MNTEGSFSLDNVGFFLKSVYCRVNRCKHPVRICSWTICTIPTDLLFVLLMSTISMINDMHCATYRLCKDF